jgi:CRISPR/Cas system CMR subunit Cmr6 (Cas7 group RAMP superfamily)
VNIPAAGPLGRAVEFDGIAIKPRRGYHLGSDASALIVLNRLAFADARGDLDKTAGRALLRWAAGSGLGQDEELVREVASRRDRAVAALRARGQAVRRLRAEPEWRLAVGLGNRANAHEIGLSLHGSYGWPVIPGSSLKGVAAAWARASGVPEDVMSRVLGGPRPGSPLRRDGAAMGTVRFLDAIPAGSPVTVAVDVLTPHVKPYYDTAAAGSGRAALPPAEYHDPVPVHFLTVTGAFAVDLAGLGAKDVEQAAGWLTEAGDQIGAGAKTAAGYGYLIVSEASGGEGSA